MLILAQNVDKRQARSIRPQRQAPPQQSSPKSLKKRFLILMFSVVFVLAFAWVRYSFWKVFPAPEIELTNVQQELQRIGPDGSFVIPFSQKMDQESIADALTFFPEMKMQWAWEGNMLIGEPERVFEEGERFHVNISRKAKSWTGRNLDKNYELTFEIGTSPSIQHVFPEGRELLITDQIAIVFSHDMISGEPTREHQFFQLVPQPEGVWIWHDAKTIVFHPKKGFSPSTSYRLSSDAKLKTTNGSVFDGIDTKVYETERLSLVENNNDKLPIYGIHEPYTLAFNFPVEMKEISKHILIMDESGKTQDVQITQGENDSELDITPTNGTWKYDQVYRVHIQESLMPKNGNMPFKEQSERSFTTESLFEIDQTYFTEAYPKIRIRLKEEFTIEQFRQAISIIPNSTTEIEKSGNVFVIDLINSQERESANVIFDPSTISAEIELPYSKVELKFKKLPSFSVKLADDEKHICIHSTQPINTSARITYMSDGSVERKLLVKSDREESLCPQESQFVYELNKSNLQPGYDDDIRFEFASQFSEELDTVLSVNTTSVQRDDVVLQRMSPLFYNYVSSVDELVFRFQTNNINKVNASLCKLTADKAVEIETQYERRWFSFEPSQEDCLRYRKRERELNPRWGTTEDHVIRVSDFFADDEDVDTGLYYFSVEAPNIYSEDGDLLQANVLMQFSHWKILSKRGESAFVWLYDQQAVSPVKGAAVSLYSNDGIRLDIRNTNDDGISRWKDNFLQYDFVSARKGSEEILLHAFSQEGLEPSQFGIPLDVSDNRYLYQFYVEDINAYDDVWEGVVVLQENTDEGPRPPNISQVVVALYDDSERLLHKEFADVDDYGMLDFSIPNALSLRDGTYQLSVCIGLHQGICQGENIWTKITKGESQDLNILQANGLQDDQERNLSQMIDVGKVQESEVGEQIPIRLSRMTPGVPALLSIEKDQVLHAEVFVPEDEEETRTITITKEMIPEAILSVFQFEQQGKKYDMKSIAVSPKPYQLSFGREEEQSQKSFLLSRYFDAKETLALEAFYPSLGTSVITAASLDADEEEKPFSTALLSKAVPTTVIIPGEYNEKGGAISSQGLFIVANKEGKFGTINTSSDEKERKNISFQTQLPAFLRPSEKLVIDMELENNENSHANLQVNLSGENVAFPNGEQFFVGLSSDQQRVSSVPVVISSQSASEASIAILASSSGNIVSAQSFNIPIEEAEYPIRTTDVIVSQTAGKHGRIIFEKPDPENWKASMTVATSPIAFVLSEISNALDQKAIDLVELSQQIGIYAQYRSILGETAQESMPLQGQFYMDAALDYIAGLQNADGGWHDNPAEESSNVLYSAQIAKALSYVVHSGNDLPEIMLQRMKNYLKEQLDIRGSARIREGISVEDVSSEERYDELVILNALSSLTPSGTSYANSWYNSKDQLSSGEKLLLLQTFEDYRDAGIESSAFRVEELIQDLQQNTVEFDGMIWVESGDTPGAVNNFIESSWYLEALVRQASSRSDIPRLINWLINNKDELFHQTSICRSPYLFAMAAYLQIYKEEVTSESITLHIGEKSARFDRDPKKPFQSFFWSQELEEGDESLEFVSSEFQPLFVEVNMERKRSELFAHNHGLSVFNEIKSGRVESGERIQGTIIIIAGQEMDQLMVVHPQIMGTQARLLSDDVVERSFTYGHAEKRYLIKSLPKGITRIEYEVDTQNKGVFQVPAVFVYNNENPNIYGLSKQGELEVR